MLPIDLGVSFVLLALSRYIAWWFSSSGVLPEQESSMKTWIKVNWRKVLTHCLAYFLPVGAMLGTYMLWSFTRFGTFSPISGQVKLWWATIPDTVYVHPVDGWALLGFASSGNFGPWSIIFSRIYDLSNQLWTWIGWRGNEAPYGFNLAIIVIFSGIVGGLLIWRRVTTRKVFQGTGVVAILVGCLAQISFYLGSGYAHTRSWYWVGELVVVALFAATLTEVLYQGAKRWKLTHTISLLGIASAVVLIFFSYANYIIHFTPPEAPEGRENYYLGDVDGLMMHTEPGSLIGMTGGGTTAYFLEDRTVINLDGLMNSLEYLRAMQAGTATAFLDELGLDYVFGNEYMVTSSAPYYHILDNRLEKIGLITGPSSFTLFRYGPTE